MSDDLLARLRTRGTYIDLYSPGNGQESGFFPDPLCAEAAATLAEQKAEIAQQAGMLDALRADLAASTTELDILRARLARAEAALQQITNPHMRWSAMDLARDYFAALDATKEKNDGDT